MPISSASTASPLTQKVGSELGYLNSKGIDEMLKRLVLGFIYFVICI